MHHAHTFFFTQERTGDAAIGRRPRPARALGWLALGCAIYVAVRYVGFKGIDPLQRPLFLLNKVLASFGLLALCASWICGRRREVRLQAIKRAAGHSGCSAILLHATLSLSLLTPGRYPTLYRSDGAYAGSGALSVAAAAVALAWMLLFAWHRHRRSRWRRGPRAARGDAARSFARIASSGTVAAALICALCVLHLSGLGYRGWLQPDQWPGSLPPVTLLSALAAAITATTVWLARERVAAPRRSPRRRRAPNRSAPWLG